MATVVPASMVKAASTTVKALTPVQIKPVRGLDGLLLGTIDMQRGPQRTGGKNSRLCAAAHRAAGGGESMMLLPMNGFG